MHRTALAVSLVVESILCGSSVAAAEPQPIRVTETDEYVQIDTDALQAQIRKKGYVSGIAAGHLLDRKTGALDAGFGLHIMDFLMAPGWKTKVCCQSDPTFSPAAACVKRKRRVRATKSLPRVISGLSLRAWVQICGPSM